MKSVYIMTLELLDFVGIGAITVFSGILIALLIGIYIGKTVFLDEILEELIKSIANNEELQKNIYAIGGLIGNGAKNGLGIAPKSGRFKWQDLIGELAVGFINNMQKVEPGSTAPSSLPPQTSLPSPNPSNDAFYNVKR